MKKAMLVSVMVMSGGLVVSGAQTAVAVVAGEPGATEQTAKTTTANVEIVDAAIANLKLVQVPTAYNFKTELTEDGVYQLNSTTPIDQPMLSVFNNKSDQTWQVNAKIDNTLKLTSAGSGTRDVTVTDFTIETEKSNVAKKVNIGDETITGKAYAIFQNEANLTAENNTHHLTTEVTNVAIAFKDNSSDKAQKLKINDKLTGTITYNLSNAPVVA